MRSTRLSRAQTEIQRVDAVRQISRVAVHDLRVVAPPAVTLTDGAEPVAVRRRAR